MSLSEEQKRRMEENRKKALAIRNAKSIVDQVLNSQPARPRPSIQNAIDSNGIRSLPSSSGNPRGVAISPHKSFIKTNPGTRPQQYQKAATSNYFQKGFALDRRDNKISARLALISRDRFQVSVPYNEEIIKVLRTMSSRSYNASVKKWDFSLVDYNILVSKLRPFCDSGVLQLEEIPQYIRNVFSEEFNGRTRPKSQPTYDLRSIDPELLDSLFPFQREGVNFAISKAGRALFADEMGLGKTIQALGVIAYFRSEWPVLIACPSSVRYNWVEAIVKWLPSVVPEAINVMTSKHDDITRLGSNEYFVITSYDVLAGHPLSLKKEQFQVIVLDESHSIKNYKTQRYKAVAPLAKAAKRLLLLTGTPAMSRPEELYCQIDCINPRLFASFKEFGNRYCDPQENKWGVDYSGASNMEELRILLEETIMIRRMKTEVLDQLPDKSRDMVVLDQSSVKLSLQSLQKAAAEIQRENLRNSERHGALLKFFSETALAKLDAVKSYICDQIKTGRKFIVFAHHRVMMDQVESVCVQEDIQYIRIDGNTPSDARKRACTKFQEDEDVQVAVLSIKAANAGITLTAASLVIFAELFWNPGILVQAEDRAHRVGQDDNVQIRYLVARGTADDHLWPLIQQKLGVLTKAGLGQDEFKDASTTVIRDSGPIPRAPISSGPDAGTAITSTASPGQPKQQTTLMQYFSSLSEEDQSVLEEMMAADDLNLDDDSDDDDVTTNRDRRCLTTVSADDDDDDDDDDIGTETVVKRRKLA